MAVSIDVSKYAHSSVHSAIAMKDYAGLRKILAGLPRLCNPSEIRTESASVVEEKKADAISAVIDRRDVPNRETPLHLAVKLSDEISTEMLMIAGADWSLQNEQGWSALQEAICNREEGIARIIVRHYQPLAWAKWCRRLPRLIGTMGRMRDFYMELTFHFESSVIPFISRIAPSDTYKIWKRGANLRADMTLAGFDGFRIQRSDQSIVFLGDGSEDGKVPPGSLCMISHKDKEVMNALDGAGAPASDAEVQQEVAAMSQTNIIRPGIDVTEAVLLPQVTWRRQEKTEMVGLWKAKVYDMHNVVVSIKSRRVPGAITDDEFFSSCNENETESEELNEILTEEERRQLEVALKLDSSDLSNENSDGIIAHRHSFYEQRDIPMEEMGGSRNGETKQEKKGWFGGWRKRDNTKPEGLKRTTPPRSSLCVEEKFADLLEDSPSQSQIKPGRHSMEIVVSRDEHRRGKDTKTSSSINSESGTRRKDGSRENEYKKGLRPVLWLSPNFPLRTEELLPLLDILANKVKAIRRLRELLTTKLPLGTFPVKVWDYTGLGYTRYNARDVDKEVLGCVVENKVLLRSLLSCLQNTDFQKTIYPSMLTSMTLSPSLSSMGVDGTSSGTTMPTCGGLAKLELNDGNSLYAKLVVGADGSKSRVRELSGFKTTGWKYSQNGVICTVEHAVENQCAWQRFLPSGPIALLPIGDKFSNIVWTMDPKESSDCKSMSEDDFVNAVNHALDHGYGPHPQSQLFGGGNILSWFRPDVTSSGSECFEVPPKVVKLASERMAFPLSLRHANQYASRRIVLIGDAAHTVHPLAGQGVNLGFGDASALSRVIAESVAVGSDIGEVHSLKKYEADRKPANIAMMALLDGFQKAYSVDFGPLNVLRAAAFHGAQYISPLKRNIISYASGEQRLPLFS